MPLNFFEQQKAALARLAGAVQARVEAETELATAFQSTADKAERDVGRARKANAAAREKELGDLDAEYAKKTGDIGGRYDREQYDANRKRDEQRGVLTDRFKAAEEKAKAEFNDKLWRLDSMLEAGQKQAKAQLESLQRKAAAGDEQVALVWAEAEPLLARGRVSRAEVEPAGEVAPADDDDPINRMQKAIDGSRDALKKVAGQIFPRVGLLACLLLAAGVTAAATFPNTDARTAGIATAGAGVGLGAALWFLVRWLARQGTLKTGAALARELAGAARGCELLRQYAAAEFETEQKRLTEKHTRKKRDTANYYQPLLDTQKAQYDAEVERLLSEHRVASEATKSKRKAETAAADDDYMARRAEAIGRLDGELSAADSVYDARMSAAHVAQSAAWEQMADEWQQGAGEVASTLEFLRAEDDRLFPYWDALTRPDRPLPDDVPPGIRLGDAAMDLAALPQGVPADERLAPPEALSGVMPAFLPFPDGCSVVLKARDEGRTQCVSALQSMMLRFLTGLPPGKVRFTIIDPVGLGENFAAFMHLADYDEKLVNSQIWTEPRHIEKRLEDLTDHIASVIQKYLRNQYKSIEEYNRAAGEVAEPYRVLVIANFPTNFTPEAAKRLVSIANSGPSCGVCTLVGVDTRAAMPRDFVLADLEQPSFVLQCKDGKFVPKDETLAPFALTVDTPPDTATVAQLVQRVGQASKDSVRVEVPFDYIAPKPAEVWKASAAKGFDVAVGRAGATRKQVFSLGRGTAQHALIAGKTGSGKSTLLHALITNLALTYSPEEAELYLIDFKEGVEFRPYAEDRLPHARVVAIESEREFGLSVLQRLVGILQERGEKFRDAGVNDLAGYRAERPTEITPRILLIVDEFQQFFVEDDKLAQEAALLLDRLVRQGRAFGIHVLLGSQTLGGAYSLARSTIDQMAVRVALQCSDADAQLILSKDNNAARLLSRPGEAIYNDQNGLVEGNDPFQVVWLPDDKREHLLGELRARAGDKYPPPLVFEGNASADIATNRALAAKLADPGEVKVPVAWLGDPVAIKEPTAVAFRTVGASNLLVIGQNEEAARGLFAASLLGLAAQLPVADGDTTGEPPALATATFTVLDGTPDDNDEAEYLRRLAGKLPHRTNAPDRSGLPVALAELTAEVERRQKGETADRSPRFLFVFGIHRLRELRKADDDFGFGRRSAERAVPPSELFHTILREGPPLGIHLIVWCDSLTNLNRAFERPQLREFGLRVLFQMSATDSSTLMDTPAASRLGRNRALFLVEDQDRPEKFRPYGPPAPEWLDRVGEKLRARVGLNPEPAAV
ncbi:MAG TPA: FtsK/SpoIIIE domain-containing protein [Gemmataceae bacterium]|nr:FtsK/SpoIIIE domain-containing protein [Gemmataceae bacterium]